MKRICAAIVATALFASCGTEATAGPDALAYSDDSATSVVESTTTTTASEPLPVDSEQEPLITPDIVRGMLATEQGRALVVSGIASEADLELAVADCFVDEVDVDTLVAISGLYVPDQEIVVDSAQSKQLSEAFTTCGIDPVLFPDLPES